MYSQTYCNKVYNVQVIFESNYFKEIIYKELTLTFVHYIYIPLLQNVIITLGNNSKSKENK